MRRHSRWIVTNPDMLHRSLLPSHQRWTTFLRSLRYVVVDECHHMTGSPEGTATISEALKTATQIASMAPLAAIATKEMVNAAFEMSLAQGIRFERRLFHGLFGTEDQKEGMTAFVEKRPGNWKGR